MLLIVLHDQKKLTNFQHAIFSMSHIINSTGNNWRHLHNISAYDYCN